jgi:hypothetical protein
MGRTIPSFRIALEMEEREWKPFRNTLDKSDRKKFLIKCLTSLLLSLSLLSHAVQPIRLYPRLMSILLHGYKQLIECRSEVEQMNTKVEGLERACTQQLRLFDF